MAKLQRFIRDASNAERKRHRIIRQQVEEEFAPIRKPITTTRKLLAKLRSKRELLGISQTELAKRMGVTRASLSRLENNGENVKFRILEKYAFALDCELVVELAEPNKQSPTTTH